MTIDPVFTDPELGTVEFSIVRRTWFLDGGVPRMTNIEEIFACGILHPADPTRLDLLPEERRHDPIVLIHSTEPLSLGEQDGDTWTSPDEIHFRNKTYRVFQIRPWQAFGFWKAWAVQV